MHSPNRSMVLALALLTAVSAACGNDSDRSSLSSEPPEQTPAEASPPPLPLFTVTLSADPDTGNAPLSTTLTANISGTVHYSELTYVWFQEDAPVEGSEHTYEVPFALNQTTQFRVEATYTSSDGRSRTVVDDVSVKVIGCADLYWTQVSMASPTDLAPGDTATFAKGQLWNSGDRIVTPFEVQAVLSEDDRLDDDDAVVATWTVDGLDAGKFGDDVFIEYGGEGFTIPADFPEGNYYVFLVVDPEQVVSECAEDDNIAVSTNNVTVEYSVALKPDVLISDISFAEGLTVNQGEFLSYQHRIANIGEGESPSYKVGFWLSTDQELDRDMDIPMFDIGDSEATVPQQDAGFSLNIYRSYLVPEDLPDGDYWIIGMADVLETVGESDETNNIAVSPYPLTMAFEEIQCADISFDTLNVAPEATYWGGTVSVVAEVSNPGTVPLLPDAEMKVFLSLQPSLNPSTATQLASVKLPAIAPKASVTIEEVLTIPSDIPVLPHYIGVIMDADGDFKECDEGNNAQIHPTGISVAATANVDVAIGNLLFHPSTVNAGESIKLSYTLSNNGSSSSTAFKVAIVFSEDATLSAEAVKSGEDFMVHEVLINSVPAGGTVQRVEDIVVPIALDHNVTTYWVGAIADIDGAISNDTNSSNNTVLGSQIEVIGAQGGCFEDNNEPNNLQGAAQTLGSGAVESLGSCGNDDWWRVNVPAGHSLLVSMKTTPVLGIEPVPADLKLVLKDDAAQMVDESDNSGDTESVNVFVVAETADYFIGVSGKTASDRAAYSLTIEVLEPVEGVDLLAADVQALPEQLYPGGLLNVSLSDVNLGQTEAGPHWVRIWASQDDVLDAADIMVAEQAVGNVAPLAMESRSVDFQLPVEISGGFWRFFVETDANNDIEEAREDNNVGMSDRVYLDPTLSCEDDDLEPNNAPELASPVVLSNGSSVLLERVVCPQLEDWYAVELAAGQSLSAVASYKHDADKGLIAIELWDTSQTALLLNNAAQSSSAISLPWVWATGTYYLRVRNQAVAGNQGPYSYNLSIASGPGDGASQCDADVFENNNSLATAANIGCGLQTATLCKADVDAYRIELVTGDALEIALEHASAGLKMTLYGEPEQPPLASKSGNGTMSYTATSDETLLLVVEAKSIDALTTFDYSLVMDGVAGSDLTVESPSLFLPEVYQGEDQLVDFMITNSCVDATSPFQVAIYLSLDATLDATDVPLSTVSTNGVDGNDSVSLSEKVSIPFSTAPGNYQLLVEADSGGDIDESNENNNINTASIAVAKLCLPDAQEPNDLSQTAPSITAPGLTDLALCPFELDWFAIDVASGETLVVQATFSHSEGDLDLRLYDPNYSLTIPVEVAGSKDDNETITWPVSVSGTYYVRVHGFDGASASYDLEVTLQ